MSEPDLHDEMVRERCAHLDASDVRLARAWLGVTPEQIDGPPVGLIVGEAPGPNTSGRLPMFPYPPTSAAGHLLAMSGMTAGVYLGRFYRRNLLDVYPESSWPTAFARERAAAVVDWIRDEVKGSLRVILLGAKVAAAFDMPVTDPAKGSRLWSSKVIHLPDGITVDMKAIPHPSGRSRIYNEQKARDGAMGAMLWAAEMV